MENKKTKERILDIALDLFSKNGYEATSMSDIAEKVGIKKASLYAHYKSKQDILDSLISVIAEHYEHHSIFFSLDDINKLDDPDVIFDFVKQQLNYIINDPSVSKIRKLFTIEQFKNKKLAKMQQNYSYDNVINFGTKLINSLIDNNILKNHDSSIMAAEFVFPISMWISECDRYPSKQNEVMKLIEKHIKQFYEIYKK